MSTFLKLLQHGHKSTTIRWAGVFGAIWAALLGIDWSGISPDLLKDLPEWMVIVVGILQTIMMGVKRAQTDKPLEQR